MNRGKVTVYMPTHNRSGLVGRAIESVLKQSYKNIELIVVNDGSQDNTFEILNLFSSDSRVKILKNDVPMGACYSRNKAIEIASGDYITGLDDDDYFIETHIEFLMNEFKESYSFVCSSIVKELSNKYRETTLHSGSLSLNSSLHYNKIGNQVLTLTERIREVGGFDESFPAFQDYDLWIRLLEKYGNGFKTKNCTYVLNSLDIDRISSNIQNRLCALELFISKHEGHFSKEHRQSMELIKMRIGNEKNSLISILKLINRGNIYSSISFIVQRLKSIIPKRIA